MGSRVAVSPCGVARSPAETCAGAPGSYTLACRDDRQRSAVGPLIVPAGRSSPEPLTLTFAFTLR